MTIASKTSNYDRVTTAAERHIAVTADFHCDVTDTASVSGVRREGAGCADLRAPVNEEATT